MILTMVSLMEPEDSYISQCGIGDQDPFNVPLAEAEVEPLQVLMVNGPFVCV